MFGLWNEQGEYADPAVRPPGNNKQKKNISQNLEMILMFAFVPQMFTCYKYPWKTLYGQIMTNQLSKLALNISRQ